MPQTIVIFEDQGYRNLLPLTHTRPACGLRCGIETLMEKVRSVYHDARMVIHAREHVANVAALELDNITVNQVSDTSALFVNGRLLATADLANTVSLEGEDVAYVVDGQIAAARISGERLAEIANLLDTGPLPDGWTEGMTKVPVEMTLIQYPWDLIAHNADQIRGDFKRLGLQGTSAGNVHPSAILVNPQQIHIAEGAQVHPGAVLMAEEGPIYLGPGAKVMAGAVLEGPVSVGAKSVIKIQAKIYEGTSLGEYCKVGGEVEECIFQAFSSKQHDGFVGHAFFGEWVNLGADTNNSDLKNNYSTVKMIIDGKQVDSGSLFVGSIFGDHSKTGINTMLNTGTTVGVGCNLYGANFPPKYVPAFSWGGADGFVEHKLGKFLETAEKVMGRRNRELTAQHRRMLETVFNETAHERTDFPRSFPTTSRPRNQPSESGNGVF